MDVLRQWLADVGIQAHSSSSLEQDFASGYLFAKLLAAHALQPDLGAFQNKGKPDAYLNNYMRLQPTLSQLGVQLDTRTAQALINKEPGLAAKVLLSIKQQLDGLTTNLEASGNPASKKLQQCTVRTSPSPGLLEAQHHKSQYAALDASNSKFFEDVMRKNSSSPNRLMESIHLKRFADEGSRQAAAAAEAAAAAAAAHAAGRSAFRGELKDKMATGRHEKATQLQRDEAVHAAILRHQDDVERQELRVEMALAELSSHRQQDQRRAAAVDAAAGIDAFEMTLKRLGASAGSNTAEAPGPAVDESPMVTLGRIRSFAPTAAKLADSKEEYLSVIKARRQEEAAARKEREGRRRRMLVEQQAARSAAEGRVEADCLLEVLVRRSAEEQKLAQHLWQLQQEKAAMEAGRKLREEQYAALKDKEWEDTLRREAELHRSLQSQHAATVQQELAAWHEQQDGSVLAAEAEKAGLARNTAWQLVQLAERVVEFRAATGGQPVPLADWRAWLSLFLAGDPALGTPVISSDPAALHEPPSAQQVINTSELRDYLAGEGAWALPPTAAHAAAAPTGPTAACVAAAPTPQSHKALGEVVADLAKLSQKLRPQLAAAQTLQKQRPQQEQQSGQQPGAEMLKGDSTQATAEDTSIAAVLEDTDAAGTGPAQDQLVSAAEATSGSGATPGADVIHTLPLRLAVVGSPFSGKSVVAHTLAHAFGLQLLSPQQLVAEATAAAAAWQQQQQHQQQQSKAAEAAPQSETGDPIEKEAPGSDPSVLVALGLQAEAQLQAGQPVPDAVLVQLLLLGMQQAKTYVAAPPEPAQPEPPAAKGTKASAPKAAGVPKSDAGAAAARHGASSGGAVPGAHAPPPLGVAAAMAAGLGSAAPGPALPANLSVGVPGRGFVVDGFPATQAQAVLLEKALTGLDLSAEQELLQGASLIVPPPASKLPQLQRPLLSGLDAVILLDCADETLALQRVLGRRLDPVTGQLFHLDFDPPPVTNPGLVERLVQPPGQEEQAAKVPERLAGWAASSPALTAWLARFSSLRRPLDGSAPLAEVLTAAGDVVSGILTAKGAAQAALAAAEAARQAQASAEKAQELSRASQLHAEAAARDLLAAKKAEMQVLPLMTGGKNPDPAAAELLKAQAAAKCAEQLKVCHAAARDAAAQAEHAHAAAEAAAAAVMSAKKAVGDASVSAEAQAQANKAAVGAEAAATAAADAASKAQAAKQLSDSFAQDAEKLASAADVPADASLGPAAQALAVPPAAVAATSAASSRPVSGRSSVTKSAGSRVVQGNPATAASTAASNLSSSTSASGSGAGADSTLRPPGSLPAPLAASLHEEWSVLERTYVEGMGRGFAGLREAHSLAVNQVAANRSWFSALLQQPDNRQALLQDFVTRFNSVELDMRKTDEAKGELLLRCEELRDALWALCDAKHDAVEAARLKVAADGSAADQVALMGSQLTSLVQVELDRFMATAQFLWSYCHSSHGVYHPSLPADKAFTHLNVLAAPEPGSAAKPNAAGAAAGASAQMAALQQRLPQLAAALKAALTAATTAEAGVLSLLSDAQQKAAAAAAHASATASAAASAAAAAAGLSTTGAAPHRQPTNAGGKGSSGTGSGGSAGAASKSSAAAAAASSKLAASSEEAAALAAAAAAALAEMPDQAALASIYAELQAALDVEVALLQQRLSVLGHRAGVMVEEVVQLHGTANSQMAEQLHRRYVEECGAVAALERVTKAAAAAGKPLAKDLRLEEEFLVVDSSQQLVPPPVEQPPARPSSPPLPPGMLSLEQLRATSSALQSAEHPAGFLAVQSAVELMLGLASQGVLPPAWREIDVSHMASAMSAFDPTYSGYLDWRTLLLALAAASLPAIHTATAAQVAVQALQLSAADGDADGQLTQQEFEGLSWWFEPRRELQEAAAAAPDQHPDVLREMSRCRQFSQLLWDVFKTPAEVKDAPVTHQPEAGNGPPVAPAAAVGPVVGAVTGGSRRRTASGSSRPLSAAATAGVAADAAAAAAPAVEAAVFMVPAQAVLLYLCQDRDLYAGIVKAVSAVTQTALPGAMVDTQGVLSMCYPLIQPEQAAQVCRAPLTAQQIAAAVAAAAAAGAAPVPLSAPVATASTAGGGSKSTGGGTGSRKPSCPGASTAAVADAPAAAGEAPVQLKASQLMYGAACERVVTLLLHRYQWVDVFVNALL